MLLKRILLSAALVVGTAVAAEATPLTLGDTVQVTYLYPNLSTVYGGPTNVSVIAGVELANFASFVDIDLQLNSILITTTRGYPGNNVVFDGLRFTDINNLIPGWSAVLNVAGTTYAGLLPGAVTSDANNIWVNLIVPAGNGVTGDTIRIDFVSSGGFSTAVPEPGSLLLFGTGGLVLIAALRRRKQLS